MVIESEAVRWTILAVVNIPVYLGLGFLFFDDFDGFFECIKFWFTPDWISLFRGEYFDDRWAEMKLFWFAGICLFVLYGEYRFFFGDPFKTKPVPPLPNHALNPDAASARHRPRYAFGFLITNAPRRFGSAG